MSQASALNIYFVLPAEDRDSECSKDMTDAFNCVKKYKGKPQWVLPSFCLSYTPTKSDVFVFEEFSGAAFEKLKTGSAKILGARCMLTCMGAGDTIPPGDFPIFTEAMRGLIVCCTGFDVLVKKKLEERIKYMGGIFDNALRTITTHVVAANNITSKATQAFAVGKSVMKKEWVEAVWNRGLQVNVRGTDKEFDSYLAPLFNNLEMTSSGLKRKDRDKLKDLIILHGGGFSGELREQQTHILLLAAATGDKYKAARQWNIKCLKPDWIYKCVEAKKVLPLNGFYLTDQNKASTPVKGAVNLTANFSMVSAIDLEARNFTHIEESATTVTDFLSQQTPSSLRKREALNVMDILNEILCKAKIAGQFLDGCNIYVSGFNQEQFEKVKRILNLGGATRFDDLTTSVTHIVAIGQIGNNLKETGAYVLPLDWLKESAELKCLAPLDKYVSVETHRAPSAPPSPLSKQGAMLLNRCESRADIAAEFENLVEEFAPEDDLMQRYNLSERSEHVPEPPAAGALNVSKAQSSRCHNSTLGKGEVFQGLKFFLSRDLSEEELEKGEKSITEAGGTVVTKKFSGVPDFAVVSIMGAALTEITAKEVVNLFFVKDCIVENLLLEPQYYHLPVSWRRNTTPLVGCVLSVSKYLSSERDFVETVITTLGANIQAILAKKEKRNILKTTHLICPEPSGLKYEGALRWGLPVVHHDWLLKCAESGIRVSEERYLVGDSKMVTATSATEYSVNKYEPVATPVQNEPLTPISSSREHFEPRNDSACTSRSVSKPPLETSHRRTPIHEPSETGIENMREQSVHKTPLAVQSPLSFMSSPKECFEQRNDSTLTPRSARNLPLETSRRRVPIQEPSEAGTENCENMREQSVHRTPLAVQSPLSLMSSPRECFEQRKDSTRTPRTVRKPPLETSLSNTPRHERTKTSEPCENIQSKIVNRAPLVEASVPSPLNKPIERLKCKGTPKSANSPEPSDINRTMTPNSPYGAFYGNDNPSPGTRKRLYKWMNQGAEFPVDSPVRKAEQDKRESTPISELLSRQLKLMMGRPEDRTPDDSPYVSPAKRPHISRIENTVQETTTDELMSGLLKMKEIEDSYSKNKSKSLSPARSSGEPKMLIVAESQPHTEIGWDDPSERNNTEPVIPPKIFMLSGLSENIEITKLLIEDSGGKVSSLAHFDKTATHLIASTSMTRAEKLMGSIAAGLWVLHPSYLDELRVVKNVYEINENEFEWGGAAMANFRPSLPIAIRDCVESACYWRKNLQIDQKHLPFHGMKIILKISASKCDSFTRLIEAGGGEVIGLEDAEGDEVFAVCEPSHLKQAAEMETYAKKKIRCVNALFINDVIQRKPTAVETNYITGFAEIWKRYNS